jgi:hypothetical protein
MLYIHSSKVPPQLTSYYSESIISNAKTNSATANGTT